MDDALTIRRYRNFMKNGSDFLCFVPMSYIDIIFEILCCDLGNCFYILEVEDPKYIYNLYKGKLKIFFVDDTLDENDVKSAFFQKIKTHAQDVNIVNKEIGIYQYAFLFKCLISDDNNAVVTESDLSDLAPALIPYMENIFSIYNFPYVKNKVGHKKWIQEFYIAKQIRYFENKKIAFIPGYIGNGEAFIMAPVINALIQKNPNKEIYISYSSKNIKYILQKIFPGCYYINAMKNVKLSEYLTEIYGNYEFQSMYSQFMKFRAVFRNKHRFDTFLAICEISDDANSLINEFDVGYILKSSYNPHVDELYAELVKKEYEYIIAVQFFTDSLTNRCWDISRMVEFSKLCMRMNIGIANLSIPNKNAVDLSSVFDIGNVYDFSHFSLLDLVTVIHHCNLFVGIDSSFGHLAGLLNKPSITLWEESTPVLFQGLPIGYRVIRNNFSFCKGSNDQNLVSIDHAMIFKKVVDILSGICELKKEFISYKDSVNMLDCVYI